MRKPAFILTAFIILLFSFQTSGFCTNWYAGAQAGPEFLTSGDDYDLDTAIAFGIYGGYKFDKLVSLEANLITATHDGKGDSELNVTSLLLGPRLTGRVTKDMDIYADAGFGVYILDLDLGPYDRSDTKAGLYLGAGIEFPLKRGIKLGMDFKYHAIFDNHPVDSDTVTLLMRLGFDL